MIKSAVLNNDKQFRYELIRDWSGGGARRVINFIGLNPSTADHEIDDNTIRRDIDFTKIHGGNCLVKTNLFGLRSTDPDILNNKYLNSYQKIGPDNWHFIEKWLKHSEMVILAWGSHAAAESVAQQLLEEYFEDYGRKFFHLGELTKGGAPRHTLYLPKNASLNQVTTLYGLKLNDN